MAKFVVMGVERPIPNGFPGGRGAMIISDIAPPEVVGRHRCLPAVQTAYCDAGITQMPPDPPYSPWSPPTMDQVVGLTGTRLVGDSAVWENKSEIAPIVGYVDDNGNESFLIGFVGTRLRFFFDGGIAEIPDAPSRLKGIAVFQWEPAKFSITYTVTPADGVPLMNVATAIATN